MPKFKKGHIPHNKGVHKPTHPDAYKTYFTPEHSGSKHASWKGGHQMMSKDCAYIWTGSTKRARRPREIWRQKHGEIPAGMCIWHIDGNKHNDDIENLELVTRAEMIRRNRKT